MKFVKWLAISAAVLAAGVAGFLGYMGMFSGVVITEKPVGPISFAYIDHLGAYSKTMPVFAKVNEELNAMGIKPERGIGVYFDNPDSVPEDKLRSCCGSIIEEKDAARIPEIVKKLKIGYFPRTSSMVVEFPIKNDLSYMLAPMKVYPILGKHILRMHYAPSESYEIYDMPAKKIIFIMPIKR